MKQGRDNLGRFTSCSHYFVWINYWYGDPDVPNGTKDCSRYECRHCDEPANPEQSQDASDRDEGAKEAAAEARYEMVDEGSER